MEDNNRTTQMFERAAQEFYKNYWEYGWSLIGVGVMLALVFCGIYFSEVAFAYWFGPGQIETIFAWAASIAISAIEVSAIKLLGNKDRSRQIKEDNKGEHKIVTYFTYGLFTFDVGTNLYGLWLTAIVLHPDMQFLSPGTVLIVGLAAIMATSEIFVGWLLRAVAVGYVGWISAKTKYDIFKDRLEKEVENSTRSNLSGNGNNNQKQNNQPQQNHNQNKQNSNNQGHMDRTQAMRPANAPEFRGNRNEYNALGEPDFNPDQYR